MAKLLKLRRGTTTQHASFTGAEGEVTVDTTKDTAVIHDGSQAGGRPLLREDMANLPAGTIDNADVNASAAIAGTKISPNFGSQNVVTTGNVTGAVIYGDGSNLTGVQPFPSGTKMIFQQTSAPTGWTKITTDNNKALRLVNGTVSSGGNQSFTSAFASRTPAGNIGASGNSTASFSGSVSGNTGNSGASTSNVSTGGNVNNHTLSNNQMPSHSHSFNMRHMDFYESVQDVQKTFSGANNAGNKGTNNSGGSGSHSHGFSGSSHSHNVNNHTHSFSGNFSGNTGNHTHNSGGFSGSAMDFAVQYLDVIICSKN